MSLISTTPSILKYFFSLLLCCCAGLLWAQEPQRIPNHSLPRQKMRSTLLPSAVRIGPAVNMLILTALDEEGTYYGLHADLPFQRIMLSLEYGHADLSRSSEPGVPVEEVFSYSSRGNYYRLGVDANLLRDKITESYDAFGDVIFFGLKYAFSNIEDEVSFRTRENIWGASVITQSNDNLSVQWLEMNAGVRVSVFENIFLGYTLRYRFSRRYIDRSSLEPYWIPGFGSGEQETNFGFDYFIYYRIPFR